ncbi:MULTISPECIES: cytochrome c oxidase subunit 2A [Kyrpidia]|uniref:Cytochrome c oxidase subunit IIa n=2 Tax=Kyrpidia spormannii TaxID=2055160 RepID=A0ACA8Z6N5_9BACL|nr:MULTISPECIES: cytochrome c oxidase subunit 2A [Kyrpidia]MCL6576464.1 cytochrome c oxidase subunit 2A [Kyrpidia sp.]CAB3390405.1 Putative cytochrome c oxidase subunit IIa [Kyrpidia spormannii]CAB3391323.1 Cytochrome c oxidase subunit IIa [Kyrpidia spormannii]HHY67335.1 cytochrome c oxidase subunit 2A [Alicyclobacillus sp.]
MAQLSSQDVRKQPEEKEESYSGSLASVLIMGAILVAVWVGVFALFLQRG